MPPDLAAAASSFFTARPIAVTTANGTTNLSTEEFNEAEDEITNMENSLKEEDIQTTIKKALKSKAKLDTIDSNVIHVRMKGCGLIDEKCQIIVRYRALWAHSSTSEQVCTN